MKQKKLYLLTLLTLCLCMTFGMAAFANGRPTTLKKSGKTTRTIYVGDKIKLRVTANGDDDFLKWTKKSSSIAFEDNDRTGDDMTFHAVKAGSAKVSCKIKGTTKKVTYTIKVKNRKVDEAGQTITRKGPAAVTLNVGRDMDLRVKKAKAVKDSYLKWSVEDDTIVRIDDDDVFDDEVEIIGRRKGSTTVTCKHLLTKKKVTFKVKVV